jgi:TonB family protein
MPTSRRLRFGIGTAIVLSVLLHLVAAPFVRFAQASPLPEATDQPLSIDLTTPRPIPPTPPPPTPTPRPVITPPSALPLPHAVPNVVHPRMADIPRRMRAPRLTPDASGARRASGGTPSIGGDGTSPGSVPDAAAGPASPSPLEASQEPTATPKVTCDRPDVAARTVAVVDPDLPEIARERNVTGTVDVRVDLTETGEVRAVSIASSPDVSLDEAALDAARRSTYAPEIVDCKAQSGSYLFRVEFDG